MEDKNQFVSYSDFLKDENFVKWYLTQDKQLEQYWNTYLEGRPNLRPLFQEACLHIEQLTLHKEKLEEPARSELLERINSRVQQAKRRKVIKLFVTYASVACVLLALFFTLQDRFIQEENVIVASIATERLSSEDISLVTSSGAMSFKNDIEIRMGKDNKVSVLEKGIVDKQEFSTKEINKLVVPYGKRSQLTLADGTQVWVNSGSVLEFPTKFQKNSRKIKLSGEIYIDVAKDKSPFVVETDGFGVVVYGTKFNVAAYKDYKQTVVLEEGSIGLRLTDGTETKMKPREMIALENNTIIEKVVGVDMQHYTSWKNGYLYFDNTPMIQVLSKIERYYNLSFDYDNYQELTKRRCTGKIYLSSDIDNVLTTLALLSSGVYERENQKIYFNIKH